VLSDSDIRGFTVKAFATDDVWAVGSKPNSDQMSSTFTLHWDGTTWSEISSPDGAEMLNSLSGVDGASPNDLWAVGTSTNSAPPFVYHTLALHWDGAVWTVVPTPVRNDNSEFFAVTALSSTSVVAVGQSNETPYSERWDGTQWHLGPTPPVTDDFGLLFGVSNRDGSAWAVGYQGFGHGEPDDLILNWTR
jgi:hypothetical protein